MSVQPMTGAGYSPSAPVSTGADKATQKETPFADLVRSLVEDTSRQQVAADGQVQKLINGETDNIHDVVLTTAKANLAFQLVMEIRNRLITSYQEVMRMQM
ncbi:MAG: flagellar hook-basal body complex protein FliE [Planctomycetaceae bacterium]|nr:flagellar hook-basal body complex protein FliE [Planctomycetaceae bacterium]